MRTENNYTSAKGLRRANSTVKGGYVCLEIAGAENQLAMFAAIKSLLYGKKKKKNSPSVHYRAELKVFANNSENAGARKERIM